MASKFHCSNCGSLNKNQDFEKLQHMVNNLRLWLLDLPADWLDELGSRTSTDQAGKPDPDSVPSRGVNEPRILHNLDDGGLPKDKFEDNEDSLIYQMTSDGPSGTADYTSDRESTDHNDTAATMNDIDLAGDETAVLVKAEPIESYEEYPYDQDYAPDLKIENAEYFDAEFGDLEQKPKPPKKAHSSLRTCFPCNKVFSTVHSLKRHTCTEVVQGYHIICDVHSTTFKTRKESKSSSCHGCWLRCKCNHCDKVCESKSGMSRHLHNQHRKKKAVKSSEQNNELPHQEDYIQD